jgi:hypothetical protein
MTRISLAGPSWVIHHVVLDNRSTAHFCMQRETTLVDLRLLQSTDVKPDDNFLFDSINYYQHTRASALSILPCLLRWR